MGFLRGTMASSFEGGVFGAETRAEEDGCPQISLIFADDWGVEGRGRIFYHGYHGLSRMKKPMLARPVHGLAAFLQAHFQASLKMALQNSRSIRFANHQHRPADSPLQFHIPPLRSAVRTRLLRRLRPIIHLADLQIRVFLPPDPMPPAIEIMRQRAGAHLAQPIQLRHPLDPNHNIPITHIFLTTKEEEGSRGERPESRAGEESRDESPESRGPECRLFPIANCNFTFQRQTPESFPLF